MRRCPRPGVKKCIGPEVKASTLVEALSLDDADDDAFRYSRLTGVDCGNMSGGSE